MRLLTCSTIIAPSQPKQNTPAPTARYINSCLVCGSNILFLYNSQRYCLACSMRLATTIASSVRPSQTTVNGVQGPSQNSQQATPMDHSHLLCNIRDSRHGTHISEVKITNAIPAITMLRGLRMRRSHSLSFFQNFLNQRSILFYNSGVRQRFRRSLERLLLTCFSEHLKLIVR